MPTTIPPTRPSVAEATTRPRWTITALVALAALAPFNLKVSTRPWTELQLRPLVIVALLLGLVLLLVAVVTSPRRRLDGVEALAVSWFGAVWASALLSEDMTVGAAGATRMSIPIIILVVTRRLVATHGDALRVARSLAIGSFVAALLGLAVWWWGSEPAITQVFVGRVTKLGSFDRLTRPWGHANIAAMALGMAIALTATFDRKWHRAIVMPVVVIAAVLTISRGALLAIAAAAIVWVVLRRAVTDAKVVAGLVVLGAVVFALSSAWTTRVDQLGDQAFYASNVAVPATFVVDGSDEQITVVVTNESATTWNREGEERVLISARWFGDDGQIWSEDWWQLPADLAAGESLTAWLGVDARLPIGEYRVRWDLVIPNTAYFGQFLGEDPVFNRIDITESSVLSNHHVRYNLVERSLDIGRIDAWKIAWREFTNAPLLGVGPNQFADAAEASLAEQAEHTGGHAHNVLLEPLATWGLLGTVPFVVLAVGALVRSLRRAFRSRDVLAVAIATSLVAIAVHGLVDWPLVSVTTGIPIGFILGLAWGDWDSIAIRSEPEARVAT